MLQSKLGGNYPTADPKEWVIGAWELLDPIFAKRIANLAKSKGVKVKLTEGYRSTARQTELYTLYLQYKRTGKGTIKSAAAPGTSWHEIRLAIDTSTQPIRKMNNAELALYGLCKPLKKEGWHIQPIETINMGIKCNMSLAPIEVKGEEEEMVYATYKDVPTWYQSGVGYFIKSGDLNDGKPLDGEIDPSYKINLAESTARALQIQYNTFKRLKLI